MIATLPVTGAFTTNCYFLIDEQSSHGFLIDPGAEANRLLQLIGQQHWTIEKILLTHGHFDHFGAVQTLQQILDIPVMIHENGKAYLEDPSINLSRFCGPDIRIHNANYFRDGDVLHLDKGNSLSLQVFHTPGHTLDSSTLYAPDHHAAFVGDTIFKGNPGNAGYPTGNGRQLMHSIQSRILKLPDETILLSGHSGPTTVQSEKWRYV